MDKQQQAQVVSDEIRTLIKARNEATEQQTIVALAARIDLLRRELAALQ